AIDTTKAKFIQLQSAIDAVTFEKFGNEFMTFIGSFATLLTTLLKAFNAIPTGAIAVVAQLDLFFLAVRLGSNLVFGLKALLSDLAINFINLAKAEQVETAALLANNSARNASGLLGPNGQPLAAAGAAAATGRFSALRSNLGKVGV